MIINTFTPLGFFKTRNFSLAFERHLVDYMLPLSFKKHSI